jgi:hypothetical protein
MLMLKMPEATEKKLVLGDYMTVHVPGLARNQGSGTELCDLQVHREDFFQRIQKERGEIFPRVQKPGGDLIDVRLRVAATHESCWNLYPEFADEDEKIVA